MISQGVLEPTKEKGQSALDLFKIPNESRGDPFTVHCSDYPLISSLF